MAAAAAFLEGRGWSSVGGGGEGRGRDRWWRQLGAARWRQRLWGRRRGDLDGWLPLAAWPAAATSTVAATAAAGAPSLRTEASSGRQQRRRPAMAPSPPAPGSATGARRGPLTEAGSLGGTAGGARSALPAWTRCRRSRRPATSRGNVWVEGGGGSSAWRASQPPPPPPSPSPPREGD